jgi:uncharacterized protein
LGPVLARRQARERDRVRGSTAGRHDRMPRSRLTGSKDVRVDPADVARIGRLVTGSFDGDVPIDLTHLLRRDPGPPGLWRYRGQLTRPIDGWVLDRIVAWARVRLAS